MKPFFLLITLLLLGCQETTLRRGQRFIFLEEQNTVLTVAHKETLIQNHYPLPEGTIVEIITPDPQNKEIIECSIILLHQKTDQEAIRKELTKKFSPFPIELGDFTISIPKSHLRFHSPFQKQLEKFLKGNR